MKLEITVNEKLETNLKIKGIANIKQCIALLATLEKAKKEIEETCKNAIEEILMEKTEEMETK